MLEFLVLAVVACMVILFIKTNRQAKNSEAVLWHHKLNSWIILNLSSLNAYMFIIIVLFCAFYGSYFGGYSGLGMGEVVGFLIGIVFGCIIGFIYCGLFSLILTLSKDISRIATSLEANSSSGNGQ